MKPSTITLVLFPLIALGGLFWYLAQANLTPDKVQNLEQKALAFKDNTVQCPQCHMFLVGTKDTAQIVTKEGKTTFFDDVGCAILWIRDQKVNMKDARFWVFAKDTRHYIEAEKAFYSINDETPMKYGFSAYTHLKEGFISYEEMRLRMLRGENMSNPKIRKKLLGY